MDDSEPPALASTQSDREEEAALESDIRLRGHVNKKKFKKSKKTLEGGGWVKCPIG